MRPYESCLSTHAFQNHIQKSAFDLGRQRKIKNLKNEIYFVFLAACITFASVKIVTVKSGQHGCEIRYE
jgi:hypothetical protein